MPVSEFRSFTGKGVTGTVEKRTVALGTVKLFEELGIAPGESGARADTLRSDGQTVMLLAIDGRAAGLIGVADPVKDSTLDAIRAALDGVRRVIVPELNMGQYRREIERLAGRQIEIVGINRADGGLITPGEILEQLKK
jgi:hypothetical protein